jgi:arylsulfatase A-like enzyme
MFGSRKLGGGNRGDAGCVFAGAVTQAAVLAAMLVMGPYATVDGAEPAARPNIVFIMADDLGWADLAFHGGNAATPNLDRLAAEGLELTQHYVAPVCSPTRTGLMTGRFWNRFGVTTPQNNRALRWDTVTLPRALKAAGYDTCLTGKWHLGSKPEWGPNHFGFDHSYGSLAGGVGSYDHFYKQGPFQVTWHRNEELITEKGHVTDLIANEAARWIGERGERPFFLYVPFTAVHLPIKEPNEWLARVPAGIEGDVPRHAVGRIVAALEKADKRQNTLLVFTSDNGGSKVPNSEQSYPPDDYPVGKLPGNNAPLRGQKGDLYEGGIRVPTIASWPGKLSPGKCEVPLHITDWMPTFCGLADASPKVDVKWDGSDVWPVMQGQATREAHVLYWVAPGARSQAVRSGDWKLIVHRGSPERVELFDLGNDPNEKTDLAMTLPERVAELQTKLAEVSKADRDAVAND